MSDWTSLSRFCLLALAGLLMLQCAPPAPASPAATKPPAAAAPTVAPAAATAPSAKAPATPAQAAAATAAPASTELLVVGNRGDIDNLDPASLNQLNSNAIADNVFNFLVSYQPGTSTLQPELATRWEISPDGKVYTFHLRQGVQFHKGYGELTSEDVKCQFERILNPEAKALWISRFSFIDKIEAVDKYTARFTLKTPYAPFLALLAGFRGGPIASCKAVAERGNGFGTDPIGTGPFVFESWTPRTELVLVRNEQYWGELPKVKRIRVIPLTDENVAASAIEAGEISLRYFRDPVILGRLEGNPNLVVERKPLAGIWALYFRNDKPPFDKLEVRQAINHAINRPQLVNFVLTGAAVEASTFLSPVQAESTTDVARYEYAPEKAKQLLAQAGFPNGFELDFLTTDLAPWPLVNPVIKDNLEAIGITVKMRQLEQGAYRAESGKGNFDITVQGFVDVPDPDTAAYTLFHSSGIPGTNFAAYRGADALIEQARAEVNPERRKAMYVELQKKIASEAAFVPLFHLGAQLVHRKNVKGAPVAVLNDFPLESVYVE